MADDREDRWNELHTLTLFAKSRAFHLRVHSRTHRFRKIFFLNRIIYTKRLFESIILHIEGLIELGNLDGRIDRCGDGHLLLLCSFFDYLRVLHLEVKRDAELQIALRNVGVYDGLECTIFLSIIIPTPQMIRIRFKIGLRVCLLGLLFVQEDGCESL